MQTIHDISLQAVRDAMTLKGPSEAGGFMCTAHPSDYMTADRLRLAREAVKHLPDGAGMHDADRIATLIEPIIRAMLAGVSNNASRQG
jgi:hypothetical protein